MRKRTTPPPDLATAISYTIPDACAVTGIGSTKLYQLVAEEKIRLIKVGRRSLIPATDLRTLIEGGVA